MLISLATGGARFMAPTSPRRSSQAGDDVRIVDAFLPVAHAGRPELPDGAELIAGDLRDPEVAPAAVAGADAVSHQAAMVGLGVDLRRPARVRRPQRPRHGQAAAGAVRSAASAARVVLASSMVVYGEGAYACPEHGLVRPRPRDPAALDRGRFDPACPRWPSSNSFSAYAASP